MEALRRGEGVERDVREIVVRLPLRRETHHMPVAVKLEQTFIALLHSHTYAVQGMRLAAFTYGCSPELMLGVVRLARIAHV